MSDKREEAHRIVVGLEKAAKEYPEVNVICNAFMDTAKRLDDVRQELILTKKALKYIDKVLYDHCRYSLECNIHCDHKFDNCNCLKLGMWAELALKKAGEVKESEGRMTTIGFLKTGDFFVLDGKYYKVGKVIYGTNGYVACFGEDKKVHRFYIDTQVEKVGE